MQAAHRCIAALDDGQTITPLDLHDMMLDDNPDIEQRVGDDEENAQVMIFAMQKALGEHIQLGTMRLRGLREDVPVLTRVRHRGARRPLPS